MKIHLTKDSFCQKLSKKEEIAKKDIQVPKGADWTIGDLSRAIETVKRIKKSGNIKITNDGYITFRVPDPKNPGAWILIEQHISNLADDRSEPFFFSTLQDFLPRPADTSAYMKEPMNNE